MTGFLADDPEGLARAIGETPRLSPEACRERAAERFSAERMIARYFERYAELAS